MIPNSVFRPLLLCSAIAIQVFGMVSCACSSQPKGDDNNTTSVNVASMTIELSDSLLRVGPTSDTIDLGRMYAGEVIRRDLAIRNVGPSAFLILDSHHPLQLVDMYHHRYNHQHGRSLLAHHNNETCLAFFRVVRWKEVFVSCQS